MKQKRLNAITPWFGCKRNMAARICQELGEHQAYWDLFAGSMAVPLAKKPSRQTVVNDLHGAAINLAMVVQDDRLSVELFDKLSRTAFCDDLYHSASHYLQVDEQERHDRLALKQAPPVLNWAYNYFIVSWMGRNGLAGTDKELSTGFCKRFTSNGGDPATRFRNVVENIPSWWEKMRGWTILNEDAFVLVDKIEDKLGTTIYVDSPYIVKSASYKHDFVPEDHRRLAAALGRFQKTRIVVSYYSHELLSSLYPKSKWTHINCFAPKQMTNGKETAEEVILTNGPSNVSAG